MTNRPDASNAQQDKGDSCLCSATCVDFVGSIGMALTIRFFQVGKLADLIPETEHSGSPVVAQRTDFLNQQGVDGLGGGVCNRIGLPTNLVFAP